VAAGPVLRGVPACLFGAEEGMQLGQRMDEAAKLDVAAVRELAWEAGAWRARLRMLSQRRLERRRFVLRKPAEAAQPEAENANAPEG
jgi:hypothetical protein